MKKKLSLGLLALILSVTSCREEQLVHTNEKLPDVTISEASVVNGRLYFTNKESLQFAYDRVKDEDDELIADYIDSKGIISLKPIVTEKK